MSDIAICLPKDTDMKTYREELRRAEEGAVLHFKVPNFPKRVQFGDACHVFHKGKAIGYHRVLDLWEGEMRCGVTGKRWSGKFIRRTGEFFPSTLADRPGFRGFRYV